MTLSVSLAACGAEDGSAESVIPADAVVIDVRTPEEYGAGHLDDAANIDFYAADFKDQIGQLDRVDKYVVYCRSGNRSGQAKEIMEQMGFTDVTNAVLEGRYALSKRTFIYAAALRLDGTNNYGLGVRHNF